jgi:preprotein translocase subunit SecD
LCICLLVLYITLPNFFDNKLFISKKRINLGLELKGGASLLLNIDLDFYFKEKLSMLAGEIKEKLLTKNIESNVQNSVVTLNNIDDYKKASVLINAINPKFRAK